MTIKNRIENLERSIQGNKSVGIVQLFVCFLVVICFLTGCQIKPESERVLVDTNSLRIVTKGSETVVYDVLEGIQYKYTMKRVKAQKGFKTPYTAVNTDTLKIVLEGSSIKIRDNSSDLLYTINRGKTTFSKWH